MSESVWISVGDERANVASCHFWNALYSQKRLDTFTGHADGVYEKYFDGKDRPRILFVGKRAFEARCEVQLENDEVPAVETVKLGWREMMHFKESTFMSLDEDLEDGVRKLVEDCDRLDTLNLITERQTELSELLADEYPKVARPVYAIAEKVTEVVNEYSTTLIPIRTTVDPCLTACLLQATYNDILPESVVEPFVSLDLAMNSASSLWLNEAAKPSSYARHWTFDEERPCYLAEHGDGGYRLIAQSAICSLDPKGEGLLKDLRSIKRPDELVSNMIESLTA